MLSRLLAKKHQDGSGVLALCVCMCLHVYVFGRIGFSSKTHAQSFSRISLSSCTILRRDKYEKHIELYWVETKTGGRKLSRVCSYKSNNLFFLHVWFFWFWYDCNSKNHLRSWHIKEKKTSSLGRRMQHEWWWIWPREEGIWRTTNGMGTASRYYRCPAVLASSINIVNSQYYGCMVFYILYICDCMVTHRIHTCWPEQIQPLWLKPMGTTMRRRSSKLWASLPWMMMHWPLHISNVSLVLLQSGESKCIVSVALWKSWMSHLRHFRCSSPQCTTWCFSSVIWLLTTKVTLAYDLPTLPSCDIDRSLWSKVGEASPSNRWSTCCIGAEHHCHQHGGNHWWFQECVAWCQHNESYSKKYIGLSYMIFWFPNTWTLCSKGRFRGISKTCPTNKLRHQDKLDAEFKESRKQCLVGIGIVAIRGWCLIYIYWVLFACNHFKLLFPQAANIKFDKRIISIVSSWIIRPFLVGQLFHLPRKHRKEDLYVFFYLILPPLQFLACFCSQNWYGILKSKLLPTCELNSFLRIYGWSTCWYRLLPYSLENALKDQLSLQFWKHKFQNLKTPETQRLAACNRQGFCHKLAPLVGPSLFSWWCGTLSKCPSMAHNEVHLFFLVRPCMKCINIGPHQHVFSISM